MKITTAQYDAFMEIAENSERFKAEELNIRPQTAFAIAERGWVKMNEGHRIRNAIRLKFGTWRK